ncbi:Wadjet anti-phage system protein JetD domain-containing protein [Rathayibacter sp. CAU 1779]
MTSGRMLTPTAARERAASVVRRGLTTWAVAGGDGVVLDVPLNPPTEAEVFADHAHAIAWTRSWDGIEGVQWQRRQWTSVGAQRVPERLVLRGADAIARFAGRQQHREWMLLHGRMRALEARLRGDGRIDVVDVFAVALRRNGRALLAIDDADFERLLDVLTWFDGHPESGYRLRQVPVRGVDTKWIGKHRGLVASLHTALSGRESLGLVAGEPRIRARILDDALVPAGFGALRDVEAPASELASLRLQPRNVLVVENLETLLALERYADTIAVFGGGFGAGSRLALLPWASDADVDLLYWGDLDSHGFAILDEFRAWHPRARSVLMDEATLLANRDLWVREPAPTAAALSRLTDAERAALALLAGEGGVRLEQERVPWADAVGVLRRTLG